MALGEVRFEVLVPDRFEHFDGGNLIKLTLQVAVVHQAQVDPVSQTSVLNPEGRLIVLLL